MMKWLVILAGCLAAVPSAARADFADGTAAYDAGDYAAALAEWRVQAAHGAAEAEAAIAGLYRFGQGVARDDAEAARWYLRAAERGEAGAQLNLGDMYAKGLGVPRDLGQAYFWLSLAAAQGRVWAARRRDEIAHLMGAAELILARERARTWMPNPD